jgi:esterase/lipase superfamily enzyme
MRYSLILSVLVILSSCAGRPDATVLQSVSITGNEAKSVRTLVVSTRKEDQETKGFSALRARNPNYQAFTVSIPKAHKPGAIEWSNHKPDPNKHFVVTQRDQIDRKAFLAEAQRSSGRGKPLTVFVHGFNYNYQEAMLRGAQMAADSNLGSDPIVFSWPSQASVAGYVADKESATYSRDMLAALLIDLTALKSPEQVTVFGHSMGGWLVMEALRQLKFKGQDSVLAKVRVVLAAPDIDADVFNQQMEVIGKLNPPLTVLVSKDDRALQVSSLIGADVSRVGALDVEDPIVRETALQQGVQFIDISALDASDALNHDRYAALASIVPKLDETRSGGSPIGQAGAFVFDALGATVSSPFRLASQVVNPR